MKRLPPISIAKRNTWLSVVIIRINGGGTPNPYSSLNQRLIYGHLGLGVVDLDVSQVSESLLEMQ